MAPRESEPQKETVERVMHEFKHGELRSGTSGQKVKSSPTGGRHRAERSGRVQPADPKENAEHLRHTKAKERRGETAKDEIEGKPSRRRSAEIGRALFFCGSGALAPKAPYSLRPCASAAG